MENYVLVMDGSDHAILLDATEELILEEDAYKCDVWIKRVTGGWPTRDRASPEEGC